MEKEMENFAISSDTSMIECWTHFLDPPPLLKSWEGAQGPSFTVICPRALGAGCPKSDRL